MVDLTVVVVGAERRVPAPTPPGRVVDGVTVAVLGVPTPTAAKGKALARY